MHMSHKPSYYKQKIAKSKKFKQKIPNYDLFHISKKEDGSIYFFLPFEPLNIYTALL